MTLINCTNNTTIFKDYGCSGNSLDSDIENVLDAKNNFSLDIPKHWKTELYFDSESSIFTTADTTKQFNNTFLIKASLINAKLAINSVDIEKIKTNLETTKTLEIISTTEGSFKNMSAILLRSHVSSPLEKTILHLYAPLSKKQYFEIEVHCYGIEAVENRLCQAIQYVNSLKIAEL